jgi:hypothetical protein
MSLLLTPRRRDLSVLAGSLSVLIGGGLALRRFPPDVYAFYPPCPVHQYTGLLCPGCGATRALAELISGHPAAAWHSNPLLLALLPFLVAYCALAARRWVARAPHAWPQIPRIVTTTLLVITAAFTLYRNL